VAPLWGRPRGTLFAVRCCKRPEQPITARGRASGDEGFMHCASNPGCGGYHPLTGHLPQYGIGWRGEAAFTDLLTLSRLCWRCAILRHVSPAALHQFPQAMGARKRMVFADGWLGQRHLITAMDPYGLPDSLKAAWQVITGA